MVSRPPPRQVIAARQLANKATAKAVVKADWAAAAAIELKHAPAPQRVVRSTGGRGTVAPDIAPARRPKAVLNVGHGTQKTGVPARGAAAAPSPDEPREKAKAIKGFKLPARLAEVADLYYTLREQRQALAKQIVTLEEKEGACREHLINNLPKSNATGIRGKLAAAKIITEPKPRVDDWAKFYKFVAANNAFDMLQRRLNETAVEDRQADGKKIPGVGSFTTVKVSLTKV